jgi:phage shock protein PspC (stress-responsive transcriptional regulator)
MDTYNRLYRSYTDKVIGGVAGGLGDYLNIDPVIIRILFVLLVIFGGSGILVYIILWIVVPERPYTLGEPVNTNPGADEGGVYGEAEKKSGNTSLIAGIVLIAFGLLFLLDRLVPMYHFWDFWPLLLVGAGVLLIKPELFKSSKNLES